MNVQIDDNNHSLFNVGTASQIVYYQEPSTGSSFLLVCSPSQYDTLTKYWFIVGPSFATQTQHYENIGPV